MVDPKPPPRIRDSTIFRRLHREAEECCLCGVAPPLEAHHVISRGQGGDDVVENLVLLCSECHRRVTVNDEVVRALLGEYLMRARWDVLDYVIGRLGDEPGRDWLRRRLFVEV